MVDRQNEGRKGISKMKRIALGRKGILTGALLGFLALVSGCVEYTVVGNEDRNPVLAESIFHNGTILPCLDEPITNIANNEVEFSSVKIRSNLGFSIISTATFGLWDPVFVDVYTNSVQAVKEN